MAKTTEFDWTPPASDYRDPAHFRARAARDLRQELDAVLLVGAAARIRATTSTGTVAGYPVFAIRDDDGRIRAFHNVCRHRGAQLLSEGAGHCGKLVVCPYHSWSYTRDGRLNKAIDFGGDAHFDAGGLEPLRRRRRGMARACLRPNQARRTGASRMARPDPRHGGRLPARARSIISCRRTATSRSTGRPTARTISNATIAARCIPAFAPLWTSITTQSRPTSERSSSICTRRGATGGLTRGTLFLSLSRC